ncbi:MAG: neutral zinc metallopeptidase [Acidimicrobiia bacterium]
MKTRAGFLGGVVAVALATASMAGAMPASARTPAASAAGYQQSVTHAIAAIQSYWKEAFPDLYGAKYLPVPANRVFAAGPKTVLPKCQGQKLTYADAKGNAFYCYGDNFVAYDNVSLMPSLYENFGGFAVALVLAHEWGHAIQDRADNAGESTISKELQADCFAGGWTRAQSDGDSTFTLAAGDLESSLAALIEFRDVPGTSADDSSAHGSAFDRVNAFQEGFEQGPERCAAYFEDPPIVVELPFSSQAEADSGGEVDAEDVIPLAIELLNDFYSQVEPAFTPLAIDSVGSFDSSKRSTIPTCGGTKLAVKTVQNRVFYCIDDDYIAFDEPFLQQIYDEIGDFGVASLIANPMATRVQVLQGQADVGANDLATVLQADCYSGGWSAAFSNGYLQGGSLSPGDLDEFVQAFLVYSRARGVSADVPITFLRVGYFRRGFFSGYSSCDLATIQREVADL